MKSQLFLTSILLFIIQLTLHNMLSAQSDSILFEPGFLSNQYSINATKANGDDVLYAMEANPEAYDLFKTANEAHIFGNIFAVSALILIAAPAGMKITNVETNWSMTWAGLGLAAVTVPLLIKSHKKIPMAIDMYNQGLPYTHKSTSLNLNIQGSKYGIGLCLNF